MDLTVQQFLLEKTQVGELCVIREGGWITGTVWIDCEDLFLASLSEKITKLKVKSTEWGTLRENFTKNSDFY